jgi:hypothetical protein
MNSALCTGYLIQAAEAAWTAGAGARKKLVFDAMLQADGDAGPTPWRCEIEDATLIGAAEKLLTAGRGVVLRAQLSGRPFIKNGVQAGFVRFLRVDRVEFVRADRSRNEAETEAQA